MNGYQIAAVICFIIAFVSLLVVPVYEYEYRYEEGPGYEVEEEEEEIIWLGVIWNVFIWLVAIGLAVKGHQVSKESSRYPSTSPSNASSSSKKSESIDQKNKYIGHTISSSTTTHEAEKTRASGDDTEIYSMAKLVLPAGKTWSISRRSLWFGREDFVGDVSREDLEYLSRDHFQIIEENGKFYIEDKNSTNGTTLNGIDITGKGKRELHDGNKICLADRISLTFRR